MYSAICTCEWLAAAALAALLLFRIALIALIVVIAYVIVKLFLQLHSGG